MCVSLFCGFRLSLLFCFLFSLALFVDLVSSLRDRSFTRNLFRPQSWNKSAGICLCSYTSFPTRAPLFCLSCCSFWFPVLSFLVWFCRSLNLFCFVSFQLFFPLSFFFFLFRLVCSLFCSLRQLLECSFSSRATSLSLLVHIHIHIPTRLRKRAAHSLSSLLLHENPTHQQDTVSSTPYPIDKIRVAAVRLVPWYPFTPSINTYICGSWIRKRRRGCPSIYVSFAIRSPSLCPSLDLLSSSQLIGSCTWHLKCRLWRHPLLFLSLANRQWWYSVGQFVWRSWSWYSSLKSTARNAVVNILISCSR